MFRGKNSLGEESQRLGVSLEAAVFTVQVIQGFFTGMTKWRVAEIVGEADGFDEVGIDEKLVGERRVGLAQEPGADGFSDLGNLQRVGQAGAIEIVFSGPKDLGFVLETAKRGGVEDTIAIDLKRAAIIVFG